MMNLKRKNFVQVSNLTKVFDVSKPWLNRLIEHRGKQFLCAVDNVNLSIDKASVYGLVGESGSGKSTIAKLITNLISPTRGKIMVDGIDIYKHPSHRHAQMIFQDPYASLNPRWRVKNIVLEPLIHQKSTITPDLHQQLLTQVGLSASDANKYPHQFSGGQRQRINIARALSSKPKLIICDEPTSALDVSVQAQVLNLMQTIQKEMALTYMFISHDLSVVRHISDKVGVLYLGNLVEEAPTEALFTNPQHPYTQMLLEATPKLDGYKHNKIIPKGEIADPMFPPSGCPFHPRCPLASAQCRQEKPKPRPHKSTIVACHNLSS